MPTKPELKAAARIAALLTLAGAASIGSLAGMMALGALLAGGPGMAAGMLLWVFAAIFLMALDDARRR